MALDKIDQEVPDFGLLRLVLEAVEFQRLRAPYLIDSNHEWLDVPECAVGLNVQANQGEADQGQRQKRDLQIGIGHQNRAELLHVLLLCGSRVLAEGQSPMRNG